MKWKCPVCGKEYKYFGIKEFSMCSKTTLFGNFKIKDLDGNVTTIDRRINAPVCCEECKIKNEEQYEYWLDTLPFYKNIYEEGVIVNG